MSGRALDEWHGGIRLARAISSQLDQVAHLAVVEHLGSGHHESNILTAWESGLVKVVKGTAIRDKRISTWTI